MNSESKKLTLGQAEEAIFIRAIQIESPAQRNRYLNEACGANDELRSDLEALLHEYAQPDSLFDEPHRESSRLRTLEEHSPKRFGDFQIVREVGRGGMGIVYEATQDSLKRRVALKVLTVGLGCSSKAIVRFRREAEAAARLHHTNIVPIHFTGMEGKSPYNVMELVNGPSLEQVIRMMRDQSRGAELDATPPINGSHACTSRTREPNCIEKDSGAKNDSTYSGRFAGTVSDSSSLGTGANYFDNVARVIGDVADALDHAHQEGVIHRDIKPSNLLLSPDGRLSVTDFGLARLVEQPGVTMTGEFVGSPRYMSPQQISTDHGCLDHRTDIYSLGATLYELLTLQPPYEADSREQVLHQVVHKDPRAPRRMNRAIPQDLETICQKAMEKNPDDRYASANEMADDLRRFVSRRAINARRIGPIGHVLRWCRRNQAQAALAGLLTVAIVVAVSMFVSNRISYERRFAVTMAQIESELESAPWQARVHVSEAMKEFPNRLHELESMLLRSGPSIRIESDVPGAVVAVRPYDGDSSDWLMIGASPIDTHLPRDRYLLRMARSPNEVLYSLRSNRIDRGEPDEPWEVLIPTTPGMVRIPKAWHAEDRSACRIPWLLSRQLPLIEEFEIDRAEVTNAAFHDFVKAGGYTKPEYWIETLGDSWKEIVEREFRDQSGKFVGPKYWVNGRVPVGLDDHPVVGISWYEAMAYAKSVDKQLPTLYHWLRGADFDGWYDGVDGWTRSNIGGKKGTLRSVDVMSLSTSEYGTFDTLGNAREWCVNEDQDGKHYAMGGSFLDDSGKKFDSVSYSAFARLEDVGFRCARYKRDAGLASAAPTSWRPIPTEPPNIESLREQFRYPHSDLDILEPDVVSFDSVDAQRISIKAAYGENERITCYLFLPDDQKFAKPFQVVFGSVVIRQDENGGPSISKGNLKYYMAMRKRGRAIIVPTLYGASYDRVMDGYSTSYDRYPDDIKVSANRAVRAAKDVSRTMDFIEKHGTDFGLDSKKVAFCSCYGSCIYSPSWLVGDEMVSGKRRFQAAIFPNGGLINCVQPPECDQLTFLPHFRVPTLLFTTKMKFDIPYNYSQKNFLALMPIYGEGTKHFHDNHHWGLSLEDFDREVDSWLNKSMGEPKLVAADDRFVQ